MHVVGIHSSVESMRFDWEGAAKFEELLKKKLKKKKRKMKKKKKASIVDLTFDPAEEAEKKKEAAENEKERS